MHALLQRCVDFIAPLFEATAEHASDVAAVHKLVHSAGYALAACSVIRGVDHVMHAACTDGRSKFVVMACWLVRTGGRNSRRAGTRVLHARACSHPIWRIYI